MLKDKKKTRLKQESKKIAERRRREELSSAYQDLMVSLYNAGMLEQKNTSMAHNKLLEKALTFIKLKTSTKFQEKLH